MVPSEVDVSGYINAAEGEIVPIEAPYRSGATSLPYILRVSGKQYFMKKLRPEYVDNVQYRNLFKKEFEVGEKIKHQNIVRYEALREDDKDVSILMEYISGATLEQKVAAMPEYFTKLANIDKFLIQILEALDYMHKEHIVHCDLTPRNIMFTRVNNDVKILDLGFCYCDSYYNTAGRTYTFAAPEQKSVKGAIDARTDIYGVGKLLEYIERNIDGRLPRLYKGIMSRALDADPSKRFQNCGEIIEILRKEKKTLKRFFVAALLVLALVPALFYVCKTQWFDELYNDFVWIISPVDYDVKHNQVFYKFGADSTLAVVGCELNANAMMVDEVPYEGKMYRVTSIAERAFYRAAHLKSVYIPMGIETIGKEAFKHCTGVSSVELPNSVVDIGMAAFSTMRSLEKVKLSNALKEVGTTAFAFCEKLTAVNIPEGVTHLCVDAFAWDSCVVSVSLPSSLEVIDRGVFWYCSSLKEVTIPKSVKRLGDYSFYYCDALTDVYMLPTVPPEICTPFKYNTVNIHVPMGCADAYRKAPGYGTFNIVDDIPLAECSAEE
ncbi:MAG: leucine-rich repeat protein [Bacteroidaceae bacterium]|nr:leucine-rich repeat protein [Bacteroidaceae bacterium]